jgi:hypothetical protein
MALKSVFLPKQNETIWTDQHFYLNGESFGFRIENLCVNNIVIILFVTRQDFCDSANSAIDSFYCLHPFSIGRIVSPPQLQHGTNFCLLHSPTLHNGCKKTCDDEQLDAAVGLDAWFGAGLVPLYVLAGARYEWDGNLLLCTKYI